MKGFEVEKKCVMYAKIVNKEVDKIQESVREF